MPARRAQRIALSIRERAELEALSCDETSRAYEALRAQVILLASDGKLNRDIAKQLDVTESFVSRWRRHWFYYPELTPTERCTHFNTELRNKVRSRTYA